MASDTIHPVIIYAFGLNIDCMTEEFDYESASESELRQELSVTEEALQESPELEYSRQGLRDHRDRLREELQSRAV